MSSAIVVTSINHPTKCMAAFAAGAQEHRYDLIVVADAKSPQEYRLAGTTYLTVEEQLQKYPKLANLIPYNSYSRKNIGYLHAACGGVKHLVDTDDDNAPYESFWRPRRPVCRGNPVGGAAWVNAYSYFTDLLIWPRGFPLDSVKDQPPPVKAAAEGFFCPIQQGLANLNPDVDAIYRLALPLPFSFDDRQDDIIIETGCWCPFNSQNTNWWAPAFPLLYLPSYCSFRMTDIWRSFVAQRVLWANEWNLSFYNATVYQERNEHNLLRDFADEIPGYLENRKICSALSELDLRGGNAHLRNDMMICYRRLVEMGVIGKEELHILDVWLEVFPD
jgi:hypothetical protein